MADTQGCVALTIPELAAVLDPPMTTEQLAHLIGVLELEPADRRRTGRRGRPAPAYDVRVIMEAHAALAGLLARLMTERPAGLPGAH